MPNKNILYSTHDDLSYAWTTFEEVYTLFLNTISNDYRIKKLFIQDETLGQNMLQTWLMKAVGYFTDCLQDLENNFDEENSTFTVSLSLTEKVILSNFMVLIWMEWNINNITQMNLSLQDSDFNRHAESQNLIAKTECKNRWREEIYHLISNYLNKNIPIAQWATGDIYQ